MAPSRASAWAASRPGRLWRVWLLAACSVAATVATAQDRRGLLDRPGVPAPGLPWAVAAPTTEPSPFVQPAPLPPVGPQSLASLSLYALAHHPATRVAWAGALADLAGVDAARALLAPTVDLDVPLSASRDSAAASPVSRTLSATLGLSWVLFDAGGRAAGVEAAQWQAVASQLSYNRELQRIASGVEQAGYTWLGTRQLVEAFGSGVEAARASLDVVQAKRRSGLATIGEAAQAEAALADARVKLVQAQASSRSAAASLAQAVGLPVATALDLVDEPDTATACGDSACPGGDVDRLLALARVSRGDLAALDAQVRQGRARVTAAQAAGRPSVSVGAQLARQWSRPGGSHELQQIGITLHIPLFDGGLVRAQTQAARAQLEQLTAQREQQAQAIDLEVWQSFQDADSASAVVAGARSLLASAGVAEAAARERYRAGVGSLLELIVAQSTTAQARVSLVQARYNARLAAAKLGYAVGAALRPQAAS